MTDAEKMEAALRAIRAALAALEGAPLVEARAAQLRDDAKSIEHTLGLLGSPSADNNRPVQSQGPTGDFLRRNRSLQRAKSLRARSGTANHAFVRWLQSRDLTVTDWSRARSLNPKTVHAWVAGTNAIPGRIADEIRRESGDAVTDGDWRRVSR